MPQYPAKLKIVPIVHGKRPSGVLFGHFYDDDGEKLATLQLISKGVNNNWPPRAVIRHHEDDDRWREPPTVIVEKPPHVEEG